MKKKEPWTVGATRIVLLLGFVGAVAFCIRQFAVDTLSVKESTLLGIVLTIASVLASWMVTHIYAGSQATSAIEEIQERSRENLRTYALKAAEKVNNLSNELTKLSLYLEEELDYTDYSSPGEALSAKEERIESTIHMIRLLKSVNDTSLSDWKGVIGEELDQQREARLEREAELREVLTDLETVIEHQRQDLAGSQENAESLRTEFRQLRQDLKTALMELGSPAALASKGERKSKRQRITLKCPRLQDRDGLHSEGQRREFQSSQLQGV